MAETLNQRLRRKLLAENLWYFVLKMLQKKPHYGFEVRAMIGEQFGFWLGNVTAYKVLYDLESRGHVKADEVSYRKRYRITPKGLKELEGARKFLKEISKT